MKDLIEHISISKNESILNAMRRMDEIKRKLLIAINEDDSFFSLVSIGDIQRSIIKNISLDTPILEIVRQDIVIARVQDDPEKIKQHMKNRRNEFMPIVDDLNNIVDIIFWEDIFVGKRVKKQIDLPVVIMAGGKGSRLKPLTNVIPKPLIPINDKTIIEDIMDRFVEFGCNPFHISVNYKADMIRYYFETLNNPEYKINFFQEIKPLGTAGSLSLLKGKINKTFFVSNCDILIDQDYAEILEYHRENSNEITIVAAMKHYPIPYGTIKTGENGQLIELIEKPDLTFKINSGMYILEPQLLDQIPENNFFHITNLIEAVLSRKGRAGVFPVSENSWKDMGSISEYKFRPA